MSAQENNQNGILSTSDVVKHYDEQGLVGSIKIYFKKSDIKTHQSKLDKPYYVIRPLIVKVGDEFDDHPNFSIFLKPKYQYRLSLIKADMWVMIIDDEVSTFKNEAGEDIEWIPGLNYSFKDVDKDPHFSMGEPEKNPGTR